MELQTKLSTHEYQSCLKYLPRAVLLAIWGYGSSRVYVLITVA
jgi:hypothetical protein